VVEWTPSAEKDLFGIFEYISKDSIHYAYKIVADFLKESEKLDQFPMIGRIVPEFNQTDIREVFIYSYRLMYHITPKQIEIIAVIHGKRDFKPMSISI
jgi:addiction module RelE/StbE family toxin